MPNWPLGVMIRHHLDMQVRTCAHRTVALAKLNFPLTVQEIQEGASGLTPAQLGTIRALWNEGVRTIEQSSELRLAFLQEAFPELRRGIVIKVQLPDPVFTGRATMYGMSTPTFCLDDVHYIVPEFHNIMPDKREKLIIWLERLLKQERMREITTACVDNILKDTKRTPTIAHLQAIWPGALAAINPDAVNYRHEKENLREWKERFRNPPLRNLQSYTPDQAFMARWGKLINVADAQIMHGMMLSEVKYPRGSIICDIEHWQRIEGDITF